MMYTKLHRIALPYIKNTADIPGNAFMLASELGIFYETMDQYNGKNKGDVPAFLELQPNGNKTIYFKTNTRYCNFYVFHEIAHCILNHSSDGDEEEADANMLACILLAPEENLPTYLKTARDLSCLCSIPIDRAEEYWQEIYTNVRHDYISDIADAYLADIHTAVSRLLNSVQVLLDEKKSETRRF